MEQEKKMPDQAMIVSSQKHYSEEGLWEKVKSVAKKAGLKVIYLALVLYYTATAATTAKAKKPPVNFSKCGIPVGAELVFVDDSTIKATVYDDRKVSYNGNLTSLSAIAKEIKGYQCAGPSFFTYNGELVCDIAARTQWK